MRGFAPESRTGGAQNDFSRFVANLQAWAAGSFYSGQGGGVRLYRFGERIESIPDWTVPTTRAFYRDYETDIVGVLRRIVRHQQASEASIIVTDGVPVTPNESHNWAAMVDEICYWTTSGNVFQILMMRGDFRDYVFSIQLGRQLPIPYDSRKHGKRPFYCWIFSRSPEFGQQLRDRLLVDHPNIKFLDITGNIFAGCRIPLRVTDEVPVSGSNEPNPLMFDTEEDSVWFFRWRRSSVPFGRIELGLEIDLEHHCADFQLSSTGITITGLGIRIIRDDHRNMQYEQVDVSSLTLVQVSSPTAPKPGRLPLYLNVRRPGDDRWYAYRLDLCSGYGTLLPPRWVTEVSTESDSRIDDWSKTIYFDRFIKSILAKPRVLGSIYIAMGR